MPTVFISYSHKDAVWKERLATQLAVLESVGLLEVWDDRRIEAGQDWEQAIEAAMSDAAVAVLMVSPDFLASKFVKTKEIPRLLERREQEGMRVIPVIVRPCPWKLVPWLSAMQARPKDGRPLVQGNRARYEADLTAIVEEIADILRAFKTAQVVEKPAVSPTSLEHPDIFTLTEPIRMEFVRVPAGPFLMGSDRSKDKDAVDNELPQHVVEIGEFYIDKYPVTNAQYAPFAKATGRNAPLAGQDDHPAVNVSWRDAVAFTKWLSQQTGRRFRLPTEAEWEKAARGPDGRIYPWGDGWDPKRANTADGGPSRTTPAGQYSPRGDSLYGCADMAGNVWEWCSTKWREDYNTSPDDDLDGDAARVLRGGAYNYNPRDSRCAFRLRGLPDLRFDNGSFRMVASP